MNRYLWRAILAGAILSVALPVEAAMMSGHGGGFSGMSGRGHFGPSGGFRQPGIRHDGFFDRDHDFDHHHRFFGRGFFFDFGFPFYYYPYSAYYYDYPPPYYYDYYDNGPVYYYPSPSYYGSGSYSVPVDSRTYLVLGHDWAKDLRLDIVTWDQFVAYVKTNIVNAPAGARDDFRRGFISGYGENGDDAFTKALKQASASEPNAATAQPSNSSQNH
jgi:hypothetical protein